MPSTFYIREIKRVGVHPVYGGGFADVYMGTYNEQAVALKVIRIFDGDATGTLKVRVLLFKLDFMLLKTVCNRNLWKKFRSGAASATRMFSPFLE